ncbi:MAG: hypothetical protein HRT45_18915 [Bdellovibrionales bacterium]|nr:hypothetical protein [Bdellovibrionales bacterium]
MSNLLVRYKRPGGFLQLVKLLEGFGKEKKEKFLAILEQEDPNWAGVIEGKLLTIEKIMSWKDDPVYDVARSMHKKNLAAVLHGLSDEESKRVVGLFGDTERRHLQDEMEMMSPSSLEISSSMVMMIETTREMIEKKLLKIDAIDSKLVIPADIEDDLASGVISARREKKPRAEDKVPVKTSSSTINSPDDPVVKFAKADHGETISAHELELLKRKVINLTKELQLLKKENVAMAEKLEKIRKIA